jgi:hypothetical protein
MAAETQNTSGGPGGVNGSAFDLPMAEASQGSNGRPIKVKDIGFTILAEGDGPIVEWVLDS